jgi:hypothetical protein
MPYFVAHLGSELCGSIHYNVEYVLFIMGSMILFPSKFLSKFDLKKMISTYIYSWRFFPQIARF